MPELIQEVQAKLETINTDVKNALQSVNEEVEKHGKIGTENAQKLDALTGSIEEVTARVLEMEQAGTSRDDIAGAVQSVGSQFVESPAFASYRDGATSKASMDVQNNLQVGSDTTVETDRRDGIMSPAIRPLGVRDMLSPGQTTSSSIEYLRELAFTNKAAEKEEGDFSYPESDITFRLVQAPVRNIGTFIPITKQMLDDAPTVASYINGRLTYGVHYRADSQTLIGNGVGQNLSGLLRPGNFTPLAGSASGDDPHKNTRRAMAQCEEADYSATSIMLNPLDAADIDLIEGDDGHFKVGTSPRLQSVPTLWGLPVVRSNAVPVGRFLLGAFKIAAQFTERRGVLIEMSDSDGSNFTKDIVTLKGTMRAAVEIWRPASLIGGSLITL